VVFAELCDDGLLTFLHNEEARTQPNQKGYGANQPCAYACGFGVRLVATATSTARTAAAATLTTKEARELAIEIAPQFIEIGWALVGSTTRTLLWLTPRLLVFLGGLLGRLIVRPRRALSFIVTTPPARIVQVEHPFDATPQRRLNGTSRRVIHVHGR
jgi:hypothetical protein